MKRSTDRILTTHAGSLPRPADLLDMVPVSYTHLTLPTNREV